MICTLQWGLLSEKRHFLVIIASPPYLHTIVCCSPGKELLSVTYFDSLGTRPSHVESGSGTSILYTAFKHCISPARLTLVEAYAYCILLSDMSIYTVHSDPNFNEAM